MPLPPPWSRLADGKNVLKKSIRDRVQGPWRNSYTKRASTANRASNSSWFSQLSNLGALVEIASAAEKQGVEPWGAPSAIR
jgi:hypothetical protein